MQRRDLLDYLMKPVFDRRNYNPGESTNIFLVQKKFFVENKENFETSFRYVVYFE
jgi:hypothetical protein